MKAISLWQPYATLLASGAKRIETRSWKPFALKPGDLVAIHAAKHWTAEERAVIDEDVFFRRFLTTAARRGLWDFNHPPLGCVVAIARYHHTERTADLIGRISEHEHAFGNYGPARYGWIFSEVRPLKPIPVKGTQGIFRWEPLAEVEYVGPRSPMSTK